MAAIAMEQLPSLLLARIGWGAWCVCMIGWCLCLIVIKRIKEKVAPGTIP